MTRCVCIFDCFERIRVNCLPHLYVLGALNMELNDFRKIFVREKLKFLVKDFQFIYP